MAALRYLAMRDPDLPKIPGVRELAGLTYGRVRTKKVRDMPTQLWMDCGRYPELSKAAKQFPGLPTTSKMLSLSWRDCKEAHDRVYAVRHLLGLPEIMRLVPDYSSPVVQLYSVLTVSLLRKDDVLKAYDWTGDYLYPVRRRSHYPVHGTEHPSILLSLSGLSVDRSNMEAWPSWVPDYGRLSQVMMGPLQQYDPALWSPNFITSTNHVEVRSEPADWRTIHIKGHTFGRIASLLDSSKVPGPRDTDTMSQLLSYSRELFEWFSRCQSFVHSHTGSVSRGYLKKLLSCARDVAEQTPEIRSRMLEADDWNRSVFARETALSQEYKSEYKPLFLPSEMFESASADLDASDSRGMSFARYEPKSLLSRSIWMRKEMQVVLIPSEVISSGITEEFAWLLRCSGTNQATLTPASLAKLDEMYSVLAPFYTNIELPSMEHRMKLCHFMTEAGPRFGWVPSEARVDDELCYFAGAPFPFVVRQVVGTDSKTIVGGAWLHDVPQWQAIGMSIREWQELMSSLGPAAGVVSSRFADMIYRQLVDGSPARERYKEKIREWEVANMGWIKFQ
jgi:hypothetical protein